MSLIDASLKIVLRSTFSISTSPCACWTVSSFTTRKITYKYLSMVDQRVWAPSEAQYQFINHVTICFQFLNLLALLSHNLWNHYILGSMSINFIGHSITKMRESYLNIFQVMTTSSLSSTQVWCFTKDIVTSVIMTSHSCPNPTTLGRDNSYSYIMPNLIDDGSKVN